MKKNVFITGGCGYKGGKIVPALLKSGHKVTVFDTTWFGNYLPSNTNLSVISGDVRNLNNVSLEGYDTVIHLASIANDPCGELNPTPTWEISVLATQQLAELAIAGGVRDFIYASSGSVYGLSESEKVTEEEKLIPISIYNKTKMCAERILLSYSKFLNLKIIRPATVCGLSPRMRLDVAVNMLTVQALQSKKITVLGGEQTRPNIHIDDLAALYQFFVDATESKNGIYNAGFENLRIIEIAEMVAEKTGANIEIKESNDPRSYRLCSDKLLELGFKPQKTVMDAISEISEAWSKGIITNKPEWHTVTWMQQNNFGRENFSTQLALSA